MRPIRPLTTRQNQVLRLVARGWTNKEIGRELGISEQGVKVHISRLLERCGAANRVELVSLTRAWSFADDGESSSLPGEMTRIARYLDGSLAEPSLGQLRRRLDGQAPSPFGLHSLEMSSDAPADLQKAVGSLRSVLGEVDIAMKLAAELPPETVSGPLLEAVRTRMRVALAFTEQVARLAARERERDGEMRVAT
jgi:DNA-binding CsgD family transcriptional regulator